MGGIQSAPEAFRAGSHPRCHAIRTRCPASPERASRTASATVRFSASRSGSGCRYHSDRRRAVHSVCS